MPNKLSATFPGQFLSIALDNQETRRRIDRAIRERYRGQMGLSSYCKMAIYRQLEVDEEQQEEDNNSSSGRGAQPTKASAATDSDTVHANTPTKELDVKYG
jgi:hypothetical protein